MELQFRLSAIAALNAHAAHYAEAFAELYEDSGLWNEGMIIDGYRNNAKQIRDDILTGITTRLAVRRVLGRRAVVDSWHEVVFHVDTRLVVIHYSEDKQESIRWVESISIGRKPIIF